MKTQPQAPLDKFVLGVLEGFYIYVISRRLAELLINFKKSDWLPCRSTTKDTGAIFYCFQRAPGQSLKKRMQFFSFSLLLKSTRHFVVVVKVKYVCKIMNLMLVTL